MSDANRPIASRFNVPDAFWHGLNAMIGLGPVVLVLLLVIQFIARPLNVVLSTFGSTSPGCLAILSVSTAWTCTARRG